jgi:hypothetical protein
MGGESSCSTLIVVGGGGGGGTGGVWSRCRLASGSRTGSLSSVKSTMSWSRWAYGADGTTCTRRGGVW